MTARALHTLSHNASPETVRASVREANARLEQAGREERARDRQQIRSIK